VQPPSGSDAEQGRSALDLRWSCHGNNVRGRALQRDEAACGTAEHLQNVREDVGDRLRLAETDADINQRRRDTHQRAVQNLPLRCLPRDPYPERERRDK